MILLVLLTHCASVDMWLLPMISTDVRLRGVGMDNAHLGYRTC